MSFENAISKFSPIIYKEAYLFQTNSCFTYDDAVQELTLKVLEIVPKLEGIENPYGFVKKCLHDLRVSMVSSFSYKSDTSIYNKETDELSLDDMVARGSDAYLAQRRSSPDAYTQYQDIIDQLLDWAKSKHEDMYNLVSNIISPSEEVLDKFENECVSSDNRLNRKQIPVHTIGSILGIKKYAVTWYVNEIRTFLSSKGYNPALV